eukprot:3529523-Amphidinium_carterae.1
MLPGMHMFKLWKSLYCAEVTEGDLRDHRDSLVTSGSLHHALRAAADGELDSLANFGTPSGLRPATFERSTVL